MTQITASRNRLTSASPREQSAQASEDTPLPSIESPEASYTFSGSSATNSQNEFRFTPPSLSLSPPPADQSQYVFGGRGYSHDRWNNFVTNAMDQLHLTGNSPLSNLRDLRTALDSPGHRQASSRATNALATPATPTRAASLTPETSSRRRRSTSRVAVEPHKVTDEDPQEDAFNNEIFQRNLAVTKAMVRDLESTLGSSALHQEPDSRMHTLHQQASQLVNFGFPNSRVVGFVGDSGAGKSSLLNSLLDVQNLVRASSSGQACTCVVTEFHYHNFDSFKIEVDLFEEDELLDQMMEMRNIYRKSKISMSSIADQQARDDLEKAATLAQHTFDSMFHGPCRPSEKLLVHGDAADVSQRFRSLIVDGRDAIHTRSNTGLTMEDCAERLIHLSSEMNSANQPAKWPYIEKIRVYSNAHILSKGLVLVDLPGLRDTNSARRNVTDRYLKKCNEIFAVCQIGRAVTDFGVQEVFDLAKQSNLSDVAIICTRSDDIKADEAKRGWAGERARTIVRLQSSIRSKQTDMEGCDSDIEECVVLGFHDELTELRAERAAAEKERDEYNRELEQFLITCRNNDVTQQLQEKYEGSVNNQRPMVFCVSNDIYRKHRNSDGRKSLPYLQLSGIIALRQHCIALMSNTQYRTATRFMRHRVPNLLSNIELWLRSGADTLDAEQRATITRTMDELEDRLTSSLLSRTSDIPRVSRELRGIFRSDIVSRQNVPAWSLTAQDQAKEWTTWYHPTYGAWCRNHGCHRTRAVGFVNWNNDAIQGMVNDLSEPWKNLEESLDSQQVSVVQSMEASTDAAIEYLEEELGQDLEKLTVLSQALVDHHNILEGDVEKAFEEAEENLRILRINGLSGMRTSFVTEALEDSYMTCALDKGTGVDDRRKAIMNDAFSNHSLFSNIMAKLRNGFRDVIDDLQRGIDEAIDSYRHQVKETLDLVRDENTAIESQQDPAFHNRVEVAFQSAMDVMQTVHDNVSDVESVP